MKFGVSLDLKKGKNMDKKIKEIYNQRYRNGYREALSGYEIARCKALDHFIRKVLKPNNVKKVLDYGSGSGLHIELWEKVFSDSELYFCDLSSVALKKLAQKHPKFRSNIAEVKNEKTPFNDNSFDAIVSIEVMEHVENLDNYLNEIYRLLKPRGVFVWTTPCANCFSIEYIYNILTNKIETTQEGYRRWKWEDPTHVRRMKTGEIKNKLQQIGFGNIKFRFRAHFFSFVCTRWFKGPLRGMSEKVMLLDYLLFKKFPNGASMLGGAIRSR